MNIFVTILSVFLALFISGTMYFRSIREDGKRYLPLIAPSMLPAVMPTVLIMSWIVGGSGMVLKTAYSWLGNIAVIISIYYLVLTLLLPLLRRFFTSGVCSLMWFLPNVMYITMYATWQRTEPSLVLYVPGNILKTAVTVWAAGFVPVFTAGLIRNISARKRILAGSYPERDPEVLSLWSEEQGNVPPVYSELSDLEPGDPVLPGDRKYIKLLRSPSVTSPLAVGLTKRRIRTVLPVREYTEEELRFIFRHELVHIRRLDAETKFFLCFIRSLLWFDPFVWVAVRKSSEDLEFSCDETVTEKFSLEEKKAYASLIIDTAGEAGGFTTCLSTTAESLRYRLKRIMETKKRFRGYILVTVTVFLLVWTSGTVAFSYNERTGEECFFPSGRENCSFSGISRREGNDIRMYEVTDADALKEKLSELKLCDISSYQFYITEESPLLIFYNDPSGKNFHIALYEHFIVWGDTFNTKERIISYTEDADLSGIRDLLAPIESDNFGFLVPEVALDMGNGQREEAAYRFLYAEGHDFAEDPEPMGSCVFDTDSSYMDIVINAEGSYPVSVSVELYDDRSEPPVYVSAGETHVELPKGELFGVITVTFRQPDPEGYFTMEYTFDVTVR